MPTQKRRRFEIRQKQKRRVKNEKIRTKLSDQQITLEVRLLRLGNKFNEFSKREERPSPQEMEQVVKEIRSLQQQLNVFFVQTIKHEETLGKNAIHMRHGVKSQIQNLYGGAERLMRKHKMPELRQLLTDLV